MAMTIVLKGYSFSSEFLSQEVILHSWNFDRFLFNQLQLEFRENIERSKTGIIYLDNSSYNLNKFDKVSLEVYDPTIKN